MSDTCEAIVQEREASILLLCLAYNNHEEVSVFLDHVLSNDHQRTLRVVVSDNTPGMQSPGTAWLKARAREYLANGSLIVVGDGTNRGYFGGFRYGLEQARQCWQQRFAWTILSNTDLTIETPDWIQTLCSMDDGIAVVAPKIVSGTSGHNQNPLYRTRPSPIKFRLLSSIFRFTATTRAYLWASRLKSRLSASFNKTAPADIVEDIYAPHGAFLCLAQGYFARGGQLECPTFLFCEELFLAEEVRALEMRITYVPRICVRHEEHTTTSTLPRADIRAHLATAHRAAYERMSR